MKNWYKKACTNSRFWDVWERHDAYSLDGFPIYVSKTEYGRAAMILDFDKMEARADVYLDPKSVPTEYESSELRFGNTYETTGYVESGSRLHSTTFSIDPDAFGKIASLDSDKSLWWFLYLRLWRPEESESVIAGSDDLVGVSKFGDEILSSFASDLKKWASAAEWERIDHFLQSSQPDFMRTLMRASTESVKKLGTALVDIAEAAPIGVKKGDAYLVANWDKMVRRNARAAAAVAAREA